jgi:hypothetical protein
VQGFHNLGLVGIGAGSSAHGLIILEELVRK